MAFALIIPVLIIAFLIQIATSVDPLFNICSNNSQNLTSNNPYHQTNLKTLLGDLYITTPLTGFGLASTGQSRYHRVYGLSLCRGDISRKNCEACVNQASSEILKRCPNNVPGTNIIWYDDCLLKYSDNDFFGKIDNTNRFYLLNVQNVTYNPETFNESVRELLGNLSKNACGETIMFAHGEVALGTRSEEEGKIYGMVQCTRDLSSVNCKKCLDDAISELPGCCGGKRGGRVVGGSCNIGYEIYPFLYL